MIIHVYVFLWLVPVSNNHSILLLALQGIVGNLSSGKSALVHRYLTGTYVQEESPEGKSLLEVILNMSDAQRFRLMQRVCCGSNSPDVTLCVYLTTCYYT